MQVEIFAICDAATDHGGKLNMLGVFEGLAAVKAPFVKDRCSVAARMRFAEEEAGEHAVQVLFVNEAGEKIGPGMGAKVRVKVPAGRKSGVSNLVVNISNLHFPAFGFFEVQLWVDGTKQSQLPLIVAKAQKRPPPSRAMEN